MSDMIERLRAALGPRYLLERGRFVQLWDRADPPLQGRVEEAREALARLSGEPRRP